MDKKKVALIGIVFVIIVIIILLLLRSCSDGSKRVVTSEEAIYSAFINASVEFTCDTIDDSSLITEEYVSSVYKKHRLPVKNNEKMMEILRKYENNSEVLGIIYKNSMPCRTGQPPIMLETL